MHRNKCKKIKNDQKFMNWWHLQACVLVLLAPWVFLPTSFPAGTGSGLDRCTTRGYQAHMNARVVSKTSHFCFSHLQDWKRKINLSFEILCVLKNWKKYILWILWNFEIFRRLFGIRNFQLTNARGKTRIIWPDI